MHQPWEEYLLAEHVLIERILSVLDLEVRKLAAGPADFARIRKTLTLLLEYGDKAHNVKEENHLFPLLVLRGIPQAGLIHSMLMDHEAERELIVQLLPKIAKLEKGTLEETQIVRKKLSEYLVARRQHLEKESSDLYPQARVVFKSDDKKRLLQAFAKIDKSIYGEKASVHVADLVQRIEEETKRTKDSSNALTVEMSEAIMHVLPWQIVYADGGNRIVYTNRAHESLANSQIGSLIGGSLQDFFPKEIADEATAAVVRLRNDALVKAEWALEIQGRPLLLRMFPARKEDGTYWGTVLIIEDLPPLPKPKK